MTRLLPKEMISTFNGVIEKIKNDTFLSAVTSEKRDVILSNMDSIKEILFHFRYPKIAIIGDSTRSRQEILSYFLQQKHLKVETKGSKGWYSFGKMEVADLRKRKRLSLSAPFPDMILCVIPKKLSDDEIEKTLGRVSSFQEKLEDRVDTVVEAIFLIEEKEMSPQFYKSRKRVFKAWKKLGIEPAAIFAVNQQKKISEELIRSAPIKTRLSLVRVLENEDARSNYIDSIIHLATATNSSIASVPLPVADLIPITTVQTFMVVSIAYARGCDLDAKLVSAFLGSLGINLTVGFAMREIVRALSQFIPVAGPFVSASIAASATSTLGKKASAYFE